MKEIKANFLKIDDDKNTLYIYEERPFIGLGDVVIKNATIIIDSNNLIEVIGEEILWEFALHKTFAEDLEYAPSDEYIRMGYKSIIDFFKGIKRAYVRSGWYELKSTNFYNVKMTNWFLVL